MIFMDISRMRILQIKLVLLIMLTSSGCSVLLSGTAVPVIHSELSPLVGKSFRTRKDSAVVHYRGSWGGVLRESFGDDAVVLCRVPKGSTIKLDHASRLYHMENGNWDILIGYVQSSGSNCRYSFHVPYDQKVKGGYQMDPELFEEVSK